MTQKVLELEQLEMMSPTQWQYVNWHDDVGGEVQRVHDVYVLFEIQTQGGIPKYVGTYNKEELSKLVDIAYSFKKN